MHWKRALLVICAFFLLTEAAQAVTIEGMTLWGGNVSGDTWGGNGQIWNTTNDGIWILGVSHTPNGPLLNNSSTTVISGLATGNYWLYAEPTNIGTYTKFEVVFSDNIVKTAIFEVSGPQGTANFWSRWNGDPDLALGWAEGSANSVGSGQTMIPSGNNDYFLQAQVEPVVAPIPANIWLLSAGLTGLATLRRRQV